MSNSAQNSEDVQQWIYEYKKTDDPNLKSKLRNFIVVAYLPLVKKIARGLARRSTDPIEDIIQVGSVGLMKAIDFFKPELNTNFKSYATYLITGEIKHYIRDKVSMIKPSREIQELAYRISVVTKELTAKLGTEPTDIELAEALSLPVQRVQQIIEGDRRKFTISLDQILRDADDNTITLNDTLADEKYQYSIKSHEDKIILQEALAKLDKRQRDVIEMSFFQDMTQKAIGEKMHISQIQVSRIQKKALNQLFKIISGKQDGVQDND